MRMRLDWLETFLAIAETGSLTRAGERVARSQSAVSLQLRQLEEAVAAKLFDRGTRHVDLTPAGERLLPYAHRTVEAAHAALGAVALDEPCTVRVGIPEEYADGLIPEVLSGLARRTAGLAIEVQCAESSVLESRIAGDRLDLALVIADEIEGRGEAVTSDPTIWLRAPDFDIEQRPLPVALFDQACSWRRRAIEALERARIDYRVVYSSASVAGIRAGIRAGLAIGALGASTATADLVAVSGADAPPELPAGELVLLRHADASQAAHDLADRTRQRLLHGLT